MALAVVEQKGEIEEGQKEIEKSQGLAGLKQEEKGDVGIALVAPQAVKGGDNYQQAEEEDKGFAHSLFQNIRCYGHQMILSLFFPLRQGSNTRKMIDMDPVEEWFSRLPIPCPLDPLETETPSRLTPIPGIKAVLFDVYGTMLISESGEVGTAEAKKAGVLFGEALEMAGWELQTRAAGNEAAALYAEAIRSSHQESRLKRGVKHPEVDIAAIWRAILLTGLNRGYWRGKLNEESLFRTATAYEALSNRIAPMPGLTETLALLQGRGLILGIVSNAQFYTPLFLEYLLGMRLPQVGFDPELLFFSYKKGESKPGTAMYEGAAEVLARKYGTAPAEALLVGNDMLNDIWAAAEVGFRTALFAGDSRSLRLRSGDSRCLSLSPDAVLAGLDQLTTLIQEGNHED